MEEDKIIKVAGMGREDVRWKGKTRRAQRELGGGVRRRGRKGSFASAELQRCESVSGLLPLELLTDPAAEETH